MQYNLEYTNYLTVKSSALLVIKELINFFFPFTLLKLISKKNILFLWKMPKNFKNFSSSENRFVTNKNDAFILLNVGTINIKIATCCKERMKKERMNQTWNKVKRSKTERREECKSKKFRFGQYQKLKSTEKCLQFPIAAYRYVRKHGKHH